MRVFEAEARKLGGPEYLVQGTIYPDVVESGSGEAATIKSHHNVGGLPADMEFKGVVEPLRELFKDEVRAPSSACRRRWWTASPSPARASPCASWAR